MKAKPNGPQHSGLPDTQGDKEPHTLGSAAWTARLREYPFSFPPVQQRLQHQQRRRRDHLFGLPDYFKAKRADAQAYLTNPYGPSSHPFNNPLTGTQATNMDWMLFGCLSSYRSGGWWDADAQTYLGALLSHWKTQDGLPK